MGFYRIEGQGFLVVVSQFHVAESAQSVWPWQLGRCERKVARGAHPRPVLSSSSCPLKRAVRDLRKKTRETGVSRMEIGFEATTVYGPTRAFSQSL